MQTQLGSSTGWLPIVYVSRAFHGAEGGIFATMMAATGVTCPDAEGKKNTVPQGKCKHTDVESKPGKGP